MGRFDRIEDIMNDTIDMGRTLETVARNIALLQGTIVSSTDVPESLQQAWGPMPTGFQDARHVFPVHVRLRDDETRVVRVAVVGRAMVPQAATFGYTDLTFNELESLTHDFPPGAAVEVWAQPGSNATALAPVAFVRKGETSFPVYGITR